MEFIEKYPHKPWDWKGLSGNQFSKHPMVIKRQRERQRDHAARTIQKGLHNWLYKGKCKDGTIGIMPRLDWKYLCNENLVNQ